MSRDSCTSSFVVQDLQFGKAVRAGGVALEDFEMLHRLAKPSYDHLGYARRRFPTVLPSSLHRVKLVNALTVCAVALSFASVRGQNPASPQSSADLMYARGVDAATGGDAATAQMLFRSAWETDEGNTKYLQALEDSYIYNRRFDKAMDVLRVYVKRSGPTSLGWALQAELLFQERHYDLAFRSAEIATKISNNNFRTHEIIGLVFAVYGKYPASLKEMMTAAAQDPNSTEVRFYLGRLHAEMGDFSAARDDFLTCLRLNPSYPHLLENLGLTYEALGDFSKAATEYQQALALEKSGKVPPSEYPYICLGLLMEKQGHAAEAVSLVEQGWQRNPDSTWANFELGRLLFYADQEKLAESYLKRAVALDPTFSRVHYFLARLYYRASRVTEAQAELAAFTSLNKVLSNREPKKTGPAMEDGFPALSARLSDALHPQESP